MEEVSTLFDGNIVGYADDLLIGIDDGDNEQEIIQLMTMKYKTIGLEVSRPKCHCTKTENVTFMGV